MAKGEFGNRAFLDAFKVQEDAEKEKTRTLFDKVLRGKMEKVSAGSFESKLPPIESVSIIPVREHNDKVGETRVSLNAFCLYRSEGGEEKRFTWSVFSDGVIHGDVPKDLPLSHEEVAREILMTVERMHVDFWHKTDLEILPEKDEGEVPPNRGEGGGEIDERPIQPERLLFLEEQARVLFGFVDSKNGFRGYHGAMFPDKIALEHPRLGNAAFVVPLPKPIEVDKNVFEKPPTARFSDAEVNEILAQTWTPISKEAHTRSELQAKFHAKRVIHTPETWQARLQEAIDALPE